MRRGIVIAAWLLSSSALAAGPKRDAPIVAPAPERALQGQGTTKADAPRKETEVKDRGARAAPKVSFELAPALRERLTAEISGRMSRDVARARSLRAEAMTLLQAFVDDAPPRSGELPEALLRLAELRWEDERDAYVRAFSEWEGRPPAGRGQAPVADYTKSRALVTRVLREFPSWGQSDLALYTDGTMALEKGEEGVAVDRFAKLLRDHPNSRFAPDAHLAEAEALFGRRDYAGALREYEAVLARKDPDLYGLALFKSAWCHWQLGRSDEAARRFVEVFELARAKGKTSGGKAARQLDELEGEALKTLVEIFSEDEKNTAKDVHAFLTKIGGEKFAGKIVRKLASTYEIEGRYERAGEAYELLVRLEPTSPDAVDWVLAVAKGKATLEDWAGAAKAYERALTDFGTGSTWARAQSDPKVAAVATGKLESELRQSATALHARAQKDQSKPEYESAAALYALYLSRFAKAEKAYLARFYLAEIDFRHLAKDDRAAENYLASAEQIPPAEAASEPGHGIRHDALYNALAALERVRGFELDAKKGRSDAAESKTDQRFAEALSLYASLYPNDPALPDLLFRQGRLYYDAGIYDPAVRIWGELVSRFPSAPEARSAGEHILDSFNRSKNYENVESWARKLKEAPAFHAKDAQANLDKLIVQSVFKQGEAKALAGDHAAAAVAYLRAAKEFAKDDRAAQACVNAEIEAEKAGDLPTLRAAAAIVTKDGAGLPEAPLGAWTAAAAFQAMGLFKEAAPLHEAIAERASAGEAHYAKFEHAKDAAYDAVLLREALGEHERAVSDAEKFGGLEGKDGDELLLLEGRAARKAKWTKKAADDFRKVTVRSKSADKRAVAAVLLAEVSAELGDDAGAKGAIAIAKELGKKHRGELGAEGREAIAHASYLEGERILGRYEAIAIGGDARELGKRLREKSDLLKEATTVFLETASLGVAEWTTASLFQIGHVYEAFASGLRKAPPPDALSASDKEAYSQQIEEFVVPIEERALDAFENGWKKARELGIYNQWTGRMREALGRLNAELYPPLREIGIEVRAEGAEALPPALDAPKRGGP